MASSSRKIINDPVYGFITIDDPLLLQVIAHPYYQRLRRVHQMAFASLVYPGAAHSRLHHSLGAYHLMCGALAELQSKGIEITPEEALGAKIAILLHDIGHGPFSHALEYQLLKNVPHEDLSLLIMHQLNAELDGRLQTAIDIFTGQYHKPFLPAYQRTTGCRPHGLPYPRQFFLRCIGRRHRLRSHSKNAHRGEAGINGGRKGHLYH